MDGDIRLNGHEYDATVLKSMSAYVMQDDLLHAELTALETLQWAALLRMTKETPEEDRAKRIEEVIDLMGIDHCRDTIVGNTRRKGISGGERKRLCIAVELLNRPKLIFLDEPTSGLDSTTAYAVIKALKNLSVVGECTAVCTIHQPSPAVFELFDNLILMKQGEAVYQGSIEGTTAFLESLHKPCPEFVSVADHLIEVISCGTDDSEEEKFIVPIDLGFGNEKFNFSDLQDARNTLYQTKILCMRNFQQQIRNWDTWLMGMAATFLIAFFLSGGIWQNLGNDQTSINKIQSALFFTFVNQGVASSLQCINSFPGERAIMLRERQAGAYTTLAYFTAKSLVDTVSLLPQPIMFSVIVYPMLGLQPNASKFFIYMGFVTLSSMAAIAVSAAVTTFCVTVELSTVLVSLFFEVSRLFGGFYTSPAQLDTPQYENWKFLDALSYIKYGFVGAALNELDNLEFTCPAGQTCVITTGEQVEALKGYDEYTMGFCAGVLVLYIFGCRVIAYLGLKFIRH